MNYIKILLALFLIAECSFDNCYSSSGAPTGSNFLKRASHLSEETVYNYNKFSSVQKDLNKLAENITSNLDNLRKVLVYFQPEFTKGYINNYMGIYKEISKLGDKMEINNDENVKKSIKEIIYQIELEMNDDCYSKDCILNNSDYIKNILDKVDESTKEESSAKMLNNLNDVLSYYPKIWIRSLKLILQKHYENNRLDNISSVLTKEELQRLSTDLQKSFTDLCETTSENSMFNMHLQGKYDYFASINSAFSENIMQMKSIISEIQNICNNGEYANFEKLLCLLNMYFECIEDIHSFSAYYVVCTEGFKSFIHKDNVLSLQPNLYRRNNKTTIENWINKIKEKKQK